MIYILITAIVLIIIAVLVWYYGFKKSEPETKPIRSLRSSKLNVRSPIMRREVESGMGNDMESGMPQSLVPRPPFIVDEDPIVITEKRLLSMARAPVPYREHSYNSRLRSQGNPFVGDLVITPRLNGVNVPLNAEPTDLQVGYFSR